jgi:hypothetical protein
VTRHSTKLENFEQSRCQSMLAKNASAQSAEEGGGWEKKLEEEPRTSWHAPRPC